MRTIKTNYLLLAAITALSIGMTSCSQSEDVAEDTTGKQTITFTSGDDDMTTRTSMGGNYTDSKFPFYWEKGDAIWINAKDHITGDNTSTAAHANFTGSVSTSAPYKIRYTGTGSYNTTNSRTNTTVNTTSDAKTLVIPPVQSIASWAEGAATSRIGANGDCGTATATGKGTFYKFKLTHRAAYLIIMPRWGTGSTNTKYKLKSVTVTTQTNKYLLSGRFGFSDTGIGSAVTNTNGSCTVKITTGSTDGLVLPTAKDQTKSINIAIKPVTTATPLYCIYEVSDGTNTYYIEKIISSKSFPVNTITPITADIKAGYDLASKNGYLDLITNKNPYSGFYEWDVPNQKVGDAFKSEEYFVSHEMNDDDNATPKIEGSGIFPNVDEGAKNDWCTNSKFNTLPTYNQVTWYMKGGCYWDANKVWGPGSDQKGGMWLKKKAKVIADEIANGNTTFNEDKFNTTQSGFIRNFSPAKNAPKDLSTNWFFLPATGRYFDGTLALVGSIGLYWLITPMNGVNITCNINLAYSGINVNGNPRYNGFQLWSLQ
jgi:hypothetical protein